MLEILSTREIAVIIWGTILMIYSVSYPDIRESFFHFIESLFVKKIRKIWVIIFLYELIITIIFFKLPFFKMIYLKDIIVWVIFLGFLYCVSIILADYEEYIKKY